MFPIIIALLWFFLYLPMNIIICSIFYLKNDEESITYYKKKNSKLKQEKKKFHKINLQLQQL